MTPVIINPDEATEALFDQAALANRLMLYAEIEAYLANLPSSPDGVTLEQFEEYLTQLDDYRAAVTRQATPGDIRNFNLGHQIGKLMLAMNQWRYLAVARTPKRREVYLKGNSTLRFLAEDELGDGNQWPKFLVANGIRYSADLLSLHTVSVPQ